jgi:branched-chain amino acid aminotransferase
VNSGEIVEMFACGTAAVITPIGELKSRLESIGRADAEPGELTVSLRQELTGIQYGTVPDKHNWMVKLY